MDAMIAQPAIPVPPWRAQIAAHLLPRRRWASLQGHGGTASVR